ncbi:MAG TPA: leucine--tRNA ligase [Candidatus Limnocylindrales bacterium]|nr:leucine--tRNA ligase [Candidatus Limnocylindrales bacterium]
MVSERTRIERYDPAAIEQRWQARWDELGLHRTDLHDTSRPKYYLLTMYPYPSGDIHIGHWSIMVPTDALARYRRMNGANVFFPIGFDAFGLPAENAAIANQVHPRDWTMRNIEKMRRQLRSMGNTFDWAAEVVTSDPAYYRWNQWLFLKFYEAGLAYRAMAPVDWCPKDQVVLAREQVEGAERVCWRCGTPVIKRDLEQWFLRITKYADELLSYDGIAWPEPIRLMQTNWIGRSEGAEIVFSVAPDEHQPGGDEIRVFTTRPDTLFGATFMVLAPEHPLVDALTHPAQREVVDAYRQQARRKSEIDRLSTAREKTGVALGAHAINPGTGERIPIWIADYVLLGYGTGAIMAVPAHDERDFEFARAHGLEVRTVVVPADGEPPADQAYAGHSADERLVDSGPFSGHRAAEAKRAIADWLASEGKGGPAITYRLRDWLVSRQRAWGTPIPIVYCDRCGMVPVPEDQLPVLLPDDFEFRPQGGNALETHASFVSTTCPSCAGPARRETDTLDTFIDSSWYWWRYLSPDRDDRAIDPEMDARWCPVDQYTGGAEHAVMHLLYSRFFSKALNDLGLVHEREPFKRLFNQGQILGEDGERMSKSRGNVQDPDHLVARYGADAIRLFLMFMKPWEADAPWSANGISGVHRFLNRVWAVTLDPQGEAGQVVELGEGEGREAGRELRALAHRTLRDVTEDYEGLRFNTIVSKLMELTNGLMRYRGTSLAGGPDWDEASRLLLLMLAPLAPHISEELWSRRLSGAGEEWRSIHTEAWPAYDESLVEEDEIELPVQVNGKLRDRVRMPAGLSEVEVEQRVRASEKVQRALDGREPTRVVHVPGRLVNLVVE